MKKGSILVGLLWCVALLAVLVVGMLHSVRLQLLTVKNHGDQVQAHYLALAGIEKAKALLYQEAKDRKRSAQSHTGTLFDDPQDFRDVPLGRGEFRVFHQGGRDDGGKVIFGVSDEESRLNLNLASQQELSKIEGMIPDVVAAIMDWRDKDNTVTPGGAEAEYYASLKPPYLPRNGPFQTVRELLMVRGVTRDLFMGEDTNQNGLLDPEEDDGKASMPRDNHDGILDAGWSGLLTVNSSAANKSALDQDRVDIQSADESELSKIKGLSRDIARAIVAWRNQTKLQTIFDLLEVTALAPQAGGRTAAAGRPANNVPNQQSRGNQNPSQTQNQQNAAPVGPKLISENLLMEIADEITVGSDEELQGAVNINTASAEVLACLPALDPQLAQAIVSYRKSAGFFASIAGLLKVDGLNAQILKQLAPRISSRSDSYRILSEGRVPSSGARKRIEVIVRFSSVEFKTLSWREDL
ncbi:MAG TPA: helix-hairpin-helix domain-containing protein [Candidatus Saccharimonadales bacterium]|nr:helix-hairpin-helix domain-containing protein [Candidatus Saccharimonadales bacterium]